MRTNEYAHLLRKALPARRRVLAVGKPGVGKTKVAEQVCAELGWDMIGLTSPLLSPVKVGGYPVAPIEAGGDARHALFDGIARAFRAERDTLLFFDDLGMANGETLKSIVDLIQHGRVDGRLLPDCVTIGGASNDVGHGADVQGLIEPLKNRWHSIVNVETHICNESCPGGCSGLVEYGLARQWPVWLCAYVRSKGAGMFEDWKPTKGLQVEFPTPRGVEYLAEWDTIGVDDPEVWSGCVGKGSARDMLAYKALVNELPSRDEILLNPEGAPVPENPSARYFVALMLAEGMDGKNFGQCIRYLLRLPQMLRAFSVRDAFQLERARKDPKHKNIATSRDYVAWGRSEDGKGILLAGTSD